MLILNLNKDKIIKGETITAEFNINDKQNKILYKNKYFVLNIRENGSTEIQKLSPLYYFGEPLVWEINPLIYKLTGTFILFITFLNDSSLNKKLVSNNFIVEEKCFINNVNTCNNLTYHTQNIQIKNDNIQNLKKEDTQMYIPSIQIFNDPNNKIEATKDIKTINNDLSNKVDINTNKYSNNKVQVPNSNKTVVINNCQEKPIYEPNTNISQLLQNKIQKKFKNI